MKINESLANTFERYTVLQAMTFHAPFKEGPQKGSFRCGKNCITCRYITDGRTNYTFSATREAAQTLFVIYIRDSIALRFEPFLKEHAV